MQYASFWQRLGAIVIDLLVLTPLLALRIWLESLSKPITIALVVPFSCIHLGYFISYEGLYGQTIGKRLMGIRIVKRNGESIGFPEAWLRNSVMILFVALNDLAMLIALTNIADHDYYNREWKLRAQNLSSLYPTWLEWPETAASYWTWSEIIVMLFNRERRSLHDFIAGTVVIRLSESPNHA